MRNFLSKLARRLWQTLWSKKTYKFIIKDWIQLNDLQSCSAVLHTMRFSQNLEPLELDVPQARRILVVAPHPDDEMLGPGGTLIKAMNAGASVHVLYLTSGRPSVSLTLEAETVEVAKKCGYTTEFLHFPLGDIPLDAAARAVAERLVMQKPEVMFVPSLFDDHDDHRRASHLLLHSQRSGFTSSGPEIWGYQVYTSLPPNVVVDITDVSEAKSKNIAVWQSQAKSRDWAHYMLGLNAYNVRFLPTAKAKYVEAFFVVPWLEYLRLCEVYFRGDGRNAYTLPTYTQN